MDRVQVLSYGGGKQTVAMIVLILKGILPRPDRIVFADTGYEKSSTFDYLNEVVQPALKDVGMKVETAGHELASVDIYAGNGDMLLPAYTRTGKLPTFCSDKWKGRVVKKFLNKNAKPASSYDMWIGFSSDEASRVRRATGDSGKWVRTFPLYEMGLSSADCIAIIKDYGWPEPFVSACWMCPNMTDPQWISMKTSHPDDFKKAVALEDELSQWNMEDYGEPIWFHSSRKPLREVDFDRNRNTKNPAKYQCSFACMV
jgi:hypothetical protein